MIYTGVSIPVVRLFNLVISSSIRHQFADCQLVLIDKKAYVTNVCHQYYISIYVYDMFYFPNFLYVLIKCNIRFGISFSFIQKFSQFKKSMTFRIGSNLPVPPPPLHLCNLASSDMRKCMIFNHYDLSCRNSSCFLMSRHQTHMTTSNSEFSHIWLF